MRAHVALFRAAVSARNHFRQPYQLPNLTGDSLREYTSGCSRKTSLACTRNGELWRPFRSEVGSYYYKVLNVNPVIMVDVSLGVPSNACMTML